MPNFEALAMPKSLATEIHMNTQRTRTALHDRLLTVPNLSHSWPIEAFL